MKSNFIKAAAATLEKAGFSREGSGVWIRAVGAFQDRVDLQASSALGGVTVNLMLLEQEIHGLLLSLAPDRMFSIYPVSVRLPMLIKGRDEWWSQSDPDAPQEMAEAIQEHGLPFLDQLHSDEGLLAFLTPTVVKWRNPTGRQYAAVLCNVLGGRKRVALS